mgnify:CR=1 FL=1
MTAQQGRWLQVPAIDGSRSFPAYLGVPAAGVSAAAGTLHDG